jgi:hypothetical protein
MDTQNQNIDDPNVENIERPPKKKTTKKVIKKIVSNKFFIN